MKGATGIPEFFAGKTVLVTGGTGFLGKCLVEKLLRDCSGVKRILLIIRGRKGESSQERFQKYLSSPAFERIRETLDERKGKLELLPGDITLPNCGLSAQVLETLSSVQVVIHSAAAIAFNMPLAKIVKLNVGGTKNVLELTVAMAEIQAFVYVSTAYCMPSDVLVEEKVYPTEVTPLEALNMFQALPADWMGTLAPKITGERNTYQYSKHLAEKLVDSYKDTLPVCIVRPGAILAAHKEPLPGWNDADSILSIYFDLCRRGDGNTFLVDASVPLIVTPADVTVNTVLAAAISKCSSDPNCPVYNCVPLDENPLKQTDMRKWAYDFVLENPPAGLVFYPWTVFTSSVLLFTLRMFFFRGIPALVGSMFGTKIGGMSSLTAYKRLKLLITLYAGFASVKRSFTTGNMKALSQSMTPEDRRTFPMDMGAICWQEFTRSFVLGMENFNKRSSQRARTTPCRMLTLRVIHYALEALFLILLLLGPVVCASGLWRYFGAAPGPLLPRSTGETQLYCLKNESSGALYRLNPT